MIEILIFFIGASLVLYVLFGGADYGAGILELLPTPARLRDGQKELINYAMGPVWEANHMWLVLIIVILFNGFPLIFTTLMTSLHIPMVALLIGIVVRGTAFTFRHYDAVQTETSQKTYTVLFGFSSLWTAIWLGVLAGSLHRGLIAPKSLDFFEAYIHPWWGLYPFAMGLFVAAIFTFLASVYLIGEARSSELRKLFTRRAFGANIAVILTSLLLFVLSHSEMHSLFKDFITHPFALSCLIAATVLFFIQWIFIRTKKSIATRVTSAGQVVLILSGWFALYFPDVIRTTEGAISFQNAAAPESTQKMLVIALLVGSLFIFPSLFYLFKVFRKV